MLNCNVNPPQIVVEPVPAEIELQLIDSHDFLVLIFFDLNVLIFFDLNVLIFFDLNVSVIYMQIYTYICKNDQIINL